MKEHDRQAYKFGYHQYSKPSFIMNQIKPMNQFISVLQILTILIQHKQLNNGSYSSYFDSKILSHYPIDKLKDISDKPTNFDTIHTSNTNCAIMYLMEKTWQKSLQIWIPSI